MKARVLGVGFTGMNRYAVVDDIHMDLVSAGFRSFVWFPYQEVYAILHRHVNDHTNPVIGIEQTREGIDVMCAHQVFAEPTRTVLMEGVLVDVPSEALTEKVKHHAAL